MERSMNASGRVLCALLAGLACRPAVAQAEAYQTSVTCDDGYAFTASYHDDRYADLRLPSGQVVRVRASGPFTTASGQLYRGQGISLWSHAGIVVLRRPGASETVCSEVER